MQLGEHYYLLTHEWIALLKKTNEGYLLRVGLSDIGQQEIGEIAFVEIADPGKKLEFKGPLGVLESSKIATEIVCPVNGTVKEVNPAVLRAPKLINSSPMNEGWLCTLLAQELPLSDLYDEQSYREHVQNITK